jgi:hypothetical protein
VPRVHLVLRVDPSAKARGGSEASLESDVLGRRVWPAEVFRAWFQMGASAWVQGRRPEGWK